MLLEARESRKLIADFDHSMSIDGELARDSDFSHIDQEGLLTRWVQRRSRIRHRIPRGYSCT